jgi:protein gp37
MAENSKIEWTDHTFNPWIGCQKVSPGCDHCYAESLAKRYGWVEWGPHGERKRTSEANWRKPRQWAKAARGTGKRPRVFCASLADVFDNQVPDIWRSDLFTLIEDTPELDWLLLTKRPENISNMIWPKWDPYMPKNIWLGTTAENAEQYKRRVPLLWRVQPGVRFVSYEPALGPITLDGISDEHLPDWLVCGGESGPGHRDMPEAWVDSIRYECGVRGVAFFMKQMAGKKPIPYRLQWREFPLSSHERNHKDQA